MNTLRILSATLLAAGFALTGCNKSPFNSDTQRERIADAAQMTFPDSEPAEGDVVAVVQGKTLTLANQGDRAYRDVQVWVNRNFVREISSIAPRAQFDLNLGEFFDSQGIKFTDQRAPVTDVNLFTNGELLTAGRPVVLE